MFTPHYNVGSLKKIKVLVPWPTANATVSLALHVTVGIGVMGVRRKFGGDRSALHLDYSGGYTGV